jgi:cytochrome c-type biogenesis protein CcmH/NrfG
MTRPPRQLNEAIRASVAAIDADPGRVQEYINLATALFEKGFIDDAIMVCRQGIQRRPDFAPIYCTLAGALTKKRDVDAAIDAGRTAIRLSPNLPEAHFALGLALRGKWDFTGAEAEYRRAIVLKGDFPEAHHNLSIALQGQGDYTGAMAASRRAIELRPDYADAHYVLAMLLLLTGQFHQGWVEHQWRWKANFVRLQVADFQQPRWDGRELNGRTILLHAEQGFGDNIQFVRYLPMVLARGGRVLLHCKPELLRLFRRLPGPAATSDRLEEMTPFDVHCSLMDLPAIFETDLASIPATVPYLSAVAESAADAANSADAGQVAPARQLNVGLVWAGSSEHPNDRARSIPLPLLAAGLSRVQGVRFHSLQFGPAAAQMNEVRALAMVDHSGDINDFADTASLIDRLDLVIAVDTAVAHLAGALARPVWMMLSFVPDWRWMLDRSDSPWYPMMRLFRQPTDGDWTAVVDTIAAALNARVSNAEDEQR